MSAIQHLKNSELKPLAMSQTISFEDAQDGSSFDVYAKEVVVESSAGSHTTGSSKVKLKSIVDYAWESRHYPGSLVAVHMGGKYLAYGLKPVGKSVGVVRVVNRETEERALIRDLLGLVSDLCFAHIRSEIMLASVDHFGNLFVHHIEQGSNGSLDCNLTLHLEHEGTQIGSALSHRVVWCPYIPEDAGSSSGDISSDEDDAAKLLVAIHGAKIEMLNVARVRASIPSAEVRVRPSLVSEGRLSMEAHSGEVVEASFSPDGTALATASTDGLVKFFLVYLPDKAKPRCLHEWCPHEGKALSCLFFLDDHRNPSPEVQFWKYVVTGTRNNHELKLWSCESWTCLQTIYFGSKEPLIGQEEGFLKAGLDLSAKFLLLSDIARKVLYVLQFGRDEDIGIPFVTTISEFCLPYPILSFGVVDAEICSNKHSSLSPSAAYPDDPSDGVTMEESKGDAEESGNRRPAVEGEEAIQDDETADGSSTVIIQIVLVQPKSLQECHIMFKSGSSNSVQGNPLLMEASPSDSKMLGADDIPIPPHPSVVDAINISADSVSCFAGKAPILTLMTPDAFSSPIRREGVTPSSVMTGAENGMSAASVDNEGNIATQGESCGGAVGSGGSSPSREVQQIFSLSDSPPGVDHEFFEDKEEGEGAVERPVDEEDAILPLTDQLDKVVVVVSQGDRERRAQKLDTSKGSLPELHSVEVENNNNEAIVENGVRQEGDGAGIGADGRRGSGLSSLILEVGSLARAVRAQNDSFQRFRSEIKSEISLLRNECCWGGEGITRVASVIESSLKPQLENSLERCVSQAMERMGPLIEVTLEEHRRDLRLQQEKILREGPSVCWDAIVRSAVASGLEPLRQQVGSEAATQAETAAREGVSLALQKNSKMLVDNIANSLLVTLRPAMLEVFRQAFAALVLPSFEKSCSHMFQQINDAFSHGTKEYGRAMEAHLERKWNTEKSKEAAALESVRNEARQLAEAIQKDVPEQIQKLSSILRESLAQEVRRALEEPLTRGLKEQRELLEGNFSKSLQSLMFSPARVAPVGTEGGKRGPTPTSSPSGVSPNGAILMRSRFSELVTQGRLNEAFQMALSASDLSLVTYLCELTTPAQVFGGKCRLEQPVLLSLVQQLSANLFDRTELKMGYLIEAVLYLDVHQPELREHLTMVLGVLQKGISSYLASRPGSCLAKEMTMLLRMAGSLMEFAKCKSVSYNYRTDSANVPLME